MLKRTVNISIILSFLTVCVLFVPNGWAQSTEKTSRSELPTKVTVRTLATDAKFIGTSMGGMKITIADANNGDILAEGLTQGETGNTDKLVRQAHHRYGQLSEPGDAKFDTTLNLSQPIKVDIRAYGPLDYPNSAVTVSKQVWLIPGKNMDEDGIILRVPGFVLEAQAEQNEYTLTSGKASIKVKAHIVMMCGCPISDGGLWDSKPMEIEAQLVQDGRTIARNPMGYIGQTNWFETYFNITGKGSYQIRVTAFDPRSNNTAIDEYTIRVN
jgi:hypothetical protein